MSKHKQLRKRKPNNKTIGSVPSSKQLADRFLELQRLRQEVRAAEFRQAGQRVLTPAFSEFA